MAKRTRRNFSGAQKVEILKRHFVGGEKVSEICEELKIQPTMFYDWQKRFFENGAKAFDREERQEESRKEARVEALEARLKKRDEVIVELMQEHLALKKSLGED